MSLLDFIFEFTILKTLKNEKNAKLIHKKFVVLKKWVRKIEVFEVKQI